MVRILIADDHDVVRHGLRMVLQSVPSLEVVSEASNGQEAIRLALDYKPDVAVVDYSLPLVSGVEVTRQIRARVPRTEVLIFTMHDSDALLQEVLRAGARGFLLKSDADEHLIAAVRSVSQRKPFFTSRVSERMVETFLASTEVGTVLSPRETAVVKLIAEGRTNKEMAALMCLSPKTIEAHRAAALRKLNLATTADLIRYAVRNNLAQG
jgi:DNA-binding NarL/FixJ family response regulator